MTLPRALAGLLLAAAACVQLGTLDRFGYWRDEFSTVRATELPYGEMVRERIGAGHPPLFFSLAWGLRRTVGKDEVGHRLAAAVPALASGVLLYAVVERLAGSWAALLAGALLLASPHQLVLAHQARAYALVQALSLAGILLLLRARSLSTRGLALFTGVSVANLHTHFCASLVVGVQYLWLLGRTGARRRAVVSAALAFGTLAPLLLAFSHATGPGERLGWLGGIRPRLPWELFGEVFFDAEPPAAWTHGTAAGAAALAGFAAWRLGRRGGALTVTWLGPVALAWATVALGLPPFVRRSWYLAGSVAAQMGLVAMGAALPSGGPRALRGLRAAAGLALLGLGVFQAGHYLQHGHFAPRKRAAELIAAERGEREAVVLCARPDAFEWDAFLHYYSGPVHDLARAERAALRDPADYDDAAVVGHPFRLALPEDTPGVWIYFRTPRPPTMAAEMALADLARRFPHERTFRLGPGRVVHRWREATP